MGEANDKLAAAWVQQVARCQEEELPDYVRDGVLSRAEAAGPLLCALLDDPEVMMGWAGVHVVSLLGELRYAPAIPRLMDLAVDDPDLGASEALQKMGPAAIPHLLEQVEAAPWDFLLTLGACAAGTNDPRVREVLRRQLDLDPERAAMAAVEFGDRSLVPDLMAALERCEVETEMVFMPGAAIVELVAAIEALGGDAGELGRAKLAQVDEARRPTRELMERLMLAGLEEFDSLA